MISKNVLKKLFPKREDSELDILSVSKNMTEDKVSEILEISDILKDNGQSVSINSYKEKTLKDLKILKNTLKDYFSYGKLFIDEEMIEGIHSNAKEPNIANLLAMSRQEKTEFISYLYEKNEDKLTAILNIEPPEKKIEFLNKYIDEEIFDEENYLKKQSEQKTFNILKELELLDSSREKQRKLREEKEKENKSLKDKGEQPIYNKQLYKMYEDNRLSRDKQDLLKDAYFHKGLNIEEFKKNMGNEIYNCSEDQLYNYIELWDKYQTNYISRDDFYYGKNVVFKEEISQDAIEEIVIPSLQEDILSKNEITECINSSIDEGDEFFKEVATLAATAKEFEYSDEEVMELIKNTADESIDKIHEEIELIEDRGTDAIDVEKLDELNTDEIKLIRENNSDIIDKNNEFEI